MNGTAFYRFSFTIAFLVIIATSPSIFARDFPFPDDVSVLEPPSDLSDDYAAFVGKWGDGKWSGNGTPIELIIGNVSMDGYAKVIYSYPDYPKTKRKTGYIHELGQIKNGWLTLNDGEETIAFKIYSNNKNKLKGHYLVRSTSSLITLTKQNYPVWKRVKALEIESIFRDKTVTIWHEKKNFKLERYYGLDGKIVTKTSFSDGLFYGTWYVDDQGRLCERANPNLEGIGAEYGIAFAPSSAPHGDFLGDARTCSFSNDFNVMTRASTAGFIEASIPIITLNIVSPGFIGFDIVHHNDRAGPARYLIDIGPVDRPTDIPEPTTLALMGLGLAGIGYRQHRSKTAA